MSCRVPALVVWEQQSAGGGWDGRKRPGSGCVAVLGVRQPASLPLQSPQMNPMIDWTHS